jgi:RHS repeat-associated protein
MILQKQNKIIGQQQVQGLDYAYTLEGWLKGVNSTSLTPAYDMGGDGSSSGGVVARDAYSFGLNYFTGDYSSINTSVSPFPGFSGLFPSGYSYKPLYNGNISAMSVNIGKLNAPLLYNYQYDQLNRLVAMDAFTGLNQSNNTWNPLTVTTNYQERAAYDANGNIQTYLRNGTTDGGTPQAMDNLSYNYTKDVNGQLLNNKLTSVNDAVATGNYPDDIDNQSANNYTYDAIGNMTGDVAGNITNITWTVYGKISNITKTDGSTIAYTYDAAGERISKTVTPASGAATTTWYVRDASGNTMAVYNVTGSGTLSQSEQDLYGSSRLGIYNRNINADATLPTGTNANLIGAYFDSYFTRGNKAYELTNHLGNVLVTVSDKKIGVDANTDGTVDYYTADVVSANDYYPGGMLMPGRIFNAGNYAYGFNGKRMDNEVSGIGNQYDYGFRIYDPRLVRFKSVDPITKKYPELTPYQFASNRPIDGIDRDGLEHSYYTDPKQMLYEAGGDISQAMGNMADRFSAKVEAGYTYFKNLFTKGNTTVTFEKKTTFSAGVSSNAANYLSYVKNNNSSEGAPSVFNFSFGKTQSISIVTKEQVGTFSLTNTMSIDSKGVSKDKNAATLLSTFAGIPADFSISTSKSSEKKNTFSLGFSLKETKFLKTPFSLDYTQSENGDKKVETKSGVEIKIGGESGVKLFGNAGFGLSF